MINVMGAGAFGTALAISLAHNGPVTLWSRDADHAAQMHATGRNDRRLPGVYLPDNLTVTNTLSLPDAQAKLLAIPTQKLRDFLLGAADHLAPTSPLVLCCKGVELSTGKRPSEVVKDILPNATIATLTGPSFAADIARGLPTALTLACDDADQGAQLQTLLATPNLRLYRSTDMIGAELGGALKNVIAIACGAAVGAGLGESARAALMTRGFAEMTRLAVKQGADPTTLNGLSGFGDLVLTCSSAQSRNYSFGQALGQGKRDESGATVEGVATAQAAHSLARSLNIDLPITRAVTALCSGELQVDQAMDMLLSRPLKEE